MTEETSNREQEQYQPLNADMKFFPIIKRKDYDVGFIVVGNTGLKIELRRLADGTVTWNQHFIPEGNMTPSLGNQAKYASIYSYAIENFVNWSANPINASRWNLPHPEHLDWVTNEPMHNFAVKLLGQENYQEIKQDGDEFHGRLHLSKLHKDQLTMSRLSKLRRYCESQNYLMAPPVNYSIGVVGIAV